MAAEPITNYIVTDHAVMELKRRGISEEAINGILKNPEQRSEVRSGRVVVQSRVQEFGSEYLVGVFVDTDLRLRWLLLIGPVRLPNIGGRKHEGTI